MGSEVFYWPLLILTSREHLFDELKARMLCHSCLSHNLLTTEFISDEVWRHGISLKVGNKASQFVFSYCVSMDSEASDLCILHDIRLQTVGESSAQILALCSNDMTASRLFDSDNICDTCVSSVYSLEIGVSAEGCIKQ